MSALQNSWFLFHVLFVVHVVLYFLNYFMYLDLPLFPVDALYSRAHYCLASAFGLVLFKTYKNSHLNVPTMHKALSDINFQDFILTLCFSRLPEAPLSLLPLAIYSVYHAVGFILPYVKKTSLESNLKSIVALQGDATLFAARLEIYAMFDIFLRFIIGRGSLLLVIVYFQFLRFQFSTSQKTRIALTELGSQLEALSLHEKCPPAIRSYYLKARQFMLGINQGQRKTE